MLARSIIGFSGVGLLLFTLAVKSAAAASASTGFGSAVEKARALLEAEVVPKVPGLSVAVASGGAVVWRDNFGFADLEKNIPVTATTRFRIGSISKPLTAAGLALLVERGRLDLDVPIQTYIPDYPEKQAPITLRLLAGHLSGIRDYRGGEARSNHEYPDSRSRLKVFEADPLEAPPGKRFKYASYNWNVIGVAIERAAHEDFVVYMEENVLGPLRLTGTIAEQPEIADPQRAQFYETDNRGAFIVAPAINNRYAWASAGYLSTAEDLVRFGSVLLHPGFLKEKSLRTLFTAQTDAGGKSTGYGVGWFIYPKPHVIYHSGETVGGLSILLMLPETGTVVAILTNRGSWKISEGHRLYFSIEEIGFRVADIFSSLACESHPAAK